jgi:hypothetical protein
MFSELFCVFCVFCGSLFFRDSPLFRDSPHVSARCRGRADVLSGPRNETPLDRLPGDGSDTA